MLRIGEFSELSQISIRMLRHYDAMSLLKPEFIDPQSGHRIYSYEQLTLAQRITALRRLDFSLEAIRDMMMQASSTMPNQLQARRNALEAERNLVDQRLAEVEKRQQLFDMMGEKALKYEVRLKSTPPLQIASARMMLPTQRDIALYCSYMLTDINQWVTTHYGKHDNTRMMIYHTDSYIEKNFDVEAAVVIPSMKPLPNDQSFDVYQIAGAELVASLTFVGALSNLVEAILVLLTWVTVHDYTPVGALREVHLKLQYAPFLTTGVVELQLPIQRVA